MSFLQHWLGRLSPMSSNPVSLAHRRFHPRLEQLEDRLVPAITWHGGPVLANVEEDAFFLGADWQNDPALVTVQGQLTGFLQHITNSSYMDMLSGAGYGVGRGNYVGESVDPIVLSGSVDDTVIQQRLAAAIAKGSLPPPDGNRLYFVFAVIPYPSVSSR